MRGWLQDRVVDIRSNGREGVKRASHDVYAKLLGEALSVTGKDAGTPIYELEWDLLIVLDACRADVMRSVFGDFEFLQTFDTTRSLGSHSKEWLRKNFTPDWQESMAQTAVVTGNAFSGELLDAEQFDVLDEVWRYAWDGEYDTVPPRPVTDRAVSVGRERDPNRLLVHYMQPHAPFLKRPELRPGTNEGDIWRAVLRGRVDRDEVWNAYEENLRTVLNEVELLLDNVSAERVLITADHGNAIGEWGIYGHPEVPIRVLREVPLVQTTGEDLGGHRPTEYDRNVGVSDDTVEDRLADLGYVE